MEENKNNMQLPVSVAEAQGTFELACQKAQGLQVVNNFCAAFQAVEVVALLSSALTDEVMNKVFMPLMNKKIGFLTDHSGKPNSRGQVQAPYSADVVRDAIIDAVTIGLMPTGNQFNIIAGRMYPTKEGYTALLRKMGVKYMIETGYDKGGNQNFAEIPCKISYQYNGEKNSFLITATVKKDSYSSHDQLRGKAERRAKKALYEYITGCDYGDTDAELIESRPLQSEPDNNGLKAIAAEAAGVQATRIDVSTGEVTQVDHPEPVKLGVPPSEQQTVAKPRKSIID